MREFIPERKYYHREFFIVKHEALYYFFASRTIISFTAEIIKWIYKQEIVPNKLTIEYCGQPITRISTIISR